MGGYVGIPTSYTPVEYIESSGTQYIDTGIRGTGTTDFEIKFRANTNNNTSQTALGCITSTSSNRFQVFYNGDTNFYFGYNTSPNQMGTVTNNADYTIKKAGNKIYKNGVEAITLTTASFSTPYNLYLFGNNYNGAFLNPFFSRIYYCKIWDGNALVRDFIPAKTDNNIPCLYDRVEEKVYYNQGTGNFTAGSATGEPVLLGCRARKIIKGYVGVPASYTPVEYIESSGTQYIDTGVPPKPTTKLEFDANIVSGDTNVWLGVWGSRTTATSDYFCLYAQTSSPHYLSPNYAGFDPGTSGNTSINFNQRYVLTQDKGQFYIDGVKATALSTTNTLVAGVQHIYLFTNNNLGSPQMRGQDIKLYGCKIYDNDTLVKNFIPVIDQDNVACLYELVEGKLYHNQGTGNFTAGSATGEPVLLGCRARKIIRGYVGVNGVAKLCFGLGVVKLPTATNLSAARFFMMSTTIGNYALFAGGTTKVFDSGTHKTTVDAYNDNLVRSTPTALNVARNRGGGTSIGDYAIFAGGTNYNSTQTQVEAYNTSLTRSLPTSLSTGMMCVASTTIGNYAVFVNGTTSSGTVNTYNSSLTRSTPNITMHYGDKYLLAGTVGDYGIFAGANDGSYKNTAEAISSSLTKTTLSSLSNFGTVAGAGASNSEYYMLSGGSELYAYDKNLVRTSAGKYASRGYLCAGACNDVVFFGGGTGMFLVDYYNTSLVRNTADNLGVARGKMSAANVSNYIIFAGGSNSNESPFDNVDIYEVN